MASPTHRATADDVSRTLAALRRRTAEPGALPLLDSFNLSGPGAAERLRGHLHDIARAALAQARGSVADAGGPDPATEGAAAAGIAADFQSGNVDREAWSALVHRNFACRLQVAAIAAHARVDRRTIQRRLDRGYELMAARLNALIERERRGADGEGSSAGQPAARPRHNIPHPPTPFIGRAEAVAAVDALLDRARCVTVVGLGGVGKSRLLRQVLAGAVARCPGGVWWVALEASAGAEGLVEAVARVLGIGHGAVQPTVESVAACIGSRPSVIALDGAERALDDARRWIDAILPACPALVVASASRSPIGAAGEHVWPLAPLAVPADGADRAAVEASEAGRLFAARARAARPTFALDDAAAAAVARIVRQLDGLPLAIELAAARVRTTGVAAIASDLDAMSETRGAAEEIGAEARRAEPRRTVAAIVGWTVDQLAPEPRAVMRRLAAFRAPFGLDDAVEAFADDALGAPAIAAGVHELAERSLVTAQEGSDGTYRYAWLQTVRDAVWGDQPEAERQRWQRLLSAQLARMAAEAATRLDAPDGPAFSARLRARRADLDHALRECIAQGRADLALTMAADLGEFWLRSGLLAMGRHHLEDALAAFGEPSSVGSDPSAEALRARALEALGSVARQQCDYAAARRYLAAALAPHEAAGDAAAAARTQRRLGAVADEEGDYDAAEAAFRAALGHFEAAGDAWSTAAVKNNLGVVATNVGRLDEARALLGESLAGFADAGATWAVGVVRFNLGNAAFDAADYRRAEAHYLASLEIARDGDDVLGIVAAEIALGNVATRLGRRAEARARYAAAWPPLSGAGDLQEVAEWLEAVAHLDAEAPAASANGAAAPRDDAVLEGAAAALSAAAALRRQIGAPIVPKDRAEVEADLDVLRCALGGTAFEAAWLEGRVRGWRAVAEAWLARPGDAIAPDAESDSDPGSAPSTSRDVALPAPTHRAEP